MIDLPQQTRRHVLAAADAADAADIVVVVVVVVAVVENRISRASVG